MSAQDHWARVWGEDDGSGRSWFTASADRSLDWVTGVAGPGASVIDVGGGSSPLVDGLLDAGITDVTVVDIAAEALAHSQTRLGARGQQVTWLAADVTTLDLGRTFDVWHDRAVLHFLVQEADRLAYVDALHRHLAPGGHAVLATFAPDGPESCSGLPVRRHSPEDLAELLGAEFELLRAEPHDHVTPWGAPQHFTWAMFRRRAGG